MNYTRSEKENRTFSRSDHCNDPFPNHKLHIQIIIIWCYHYYSKQLFAKNENVYSKIFLKLMKNQYFQFFLRHWFLNLWRLINIWIWYLELAFIPIWLIRKKESDQKIQKYLNKNSPKTGYRLHSKFKWEAKSTG